ncbi:MAG TPA: glutathione S-transferase family protein [Sphingomonadales bacterium]|nr:glutathione S-transferase family protein [Sphingomonadales bacterium]
MYTLFEFPESGNCYKIRLAFSNLGLPFTSKFVDIRKGESRTPEFLKKNPAGQVPLVMLPDGIYLPESHAILWYVTWGTPLLPADQWLQTQILRWMSFEQYKLEPKIGTARFFLKSMGKKPEELGPKLKELHDGARFALGILEADLEKKSFLVGGAYSIADIALYGYTHVSDEAGIPLDPYPAIRAWLKRVEAQPGYIAINA